MSDDELRTRYAARSAELQALNEAIPSPARSTAALEAELPELRQ